MSNYPDDFKGTPYDKEKDATPEQVAAEAALHWIDTLKHRIRLMLIDGARTYNLKITAKDTMNAMEYIDDAFADLFADERERLMEIAQ